MQIHVSPEADKWFREELELDSGSAVHFFGKYGGSTPVHTGFSVGLEVKPKENIMSEATLNGITYFAETGDDWFFNGYDLVVEYDPLVNEPIYQFTEAK